MKGLLILILVAGMLSSCAVTGFSVSGDKEKKFVSDFLTYMDDTKGTQYDAMMNFMSRKYLNEHKIEKGTYHVNNYSVSGFSIESYNSKGIITAKIWGYKKAWMHLLTFQLTLENGKLYILPKPNNESFIDPWSEVQSDIKE